MSETSDMSMDLAPGHPGPREPWVIGYVQHLTGAALTLRQTTVRRFPADFIAPWDQLESPRLLLVAEGWLEYTIGEASMTFGAGQMVFVPPGVERTWRVVGDSPLRLAWFLYSTAPDERRPPAPCWRDRCDLTFERQSLGRLVRQRPTPDEVEDITRMLEAKAALARFFTHARRLEDSAPAPPARSEQAVREAADYAAGATDVAVGEWVSVGFTYDSNWIRAYYNGVLDEREPAADPADDKRDDPYFTSEGPNGGHRGLNPYYHGRGIFDYDPGANYDPPKIDPPDFTVGARFAVGSVLSETLKGAFGGLMVFDRALSDAEMADIHQAVFDGQDEPAYEQTFHNTAAPPTSRSTRSTTTSRRTGERCTARMPGRATG